VANKKVSELTNLASLSDNDIVPVVSGGTSKKLSASTIKTYITSNTTLFDFGIEEPITALTGATSVVAHDVSTSTIFNHTSIAGNFTCNVTNLNLSSGNAINITLILNQGATAYMPTAFQIGGVAKTIKWLNNVVPAGSASKIDVASFSILNISGTYTVLGSLSTFG
jgi:hypothetical protein